MITSRVDKTISADIDAISTVCSDHRSFHNVMSDVFKSTRPRSLRGDVAIAEHHMDIAGMKLIIMAKHVTSPNKHDIIFAGGDAKGSSLTMTYKEYGKNVQLQIHAKIKVPLFKRIFAKTLNKKLEQDLSSMANSIEKKVRTDL